MQREVAQIADGLGKAVDPKIAATVVALKAHDIHTSGSCEGHLDHGIAGPWVDIESDQDTSALRDQAFQFRERAEKLDTSPREKKPKKEVEFLLKEYHSLLEQAKTPHLQERKKLMNLLAEFYEKRNMPYDVRLQAVEWGFGITRLENQGASLQPLADEATRAQKLAEYQKEMAEFTQFLKEKFFQQV